MMCIPRSLLIHSAEIKTIINEDCFGKKETDEGIKLKYIRIDREGRDEKSGHGFKNMGNATLIYDTVSSLPRNFEFFKGQLVSFEGAEFRINSVKKLYDKNRLHHIEAGLEEIG